MLGADGAFDGVDITAVAVDDLPTVATRSAEADFGGFDNAHLEAIFQQRYGSGEAGVAGADDAYVRFGFAVQFRAWRNWIG
ncbi:hypothetical protein D9M68_972300 [compost metagenome]